nr:hypothetical protein [Tanacetum cinerariifolium]
MYSNPSQPPVSTPVDTRMHKEDHQVTGNPTSLGVTSEARFNPQLSNGMSAFNLNEPIYSVSFIIHSESSSGNDASAASTTEADLGNFAPNDFVLQQQDQTISISEGLETVLTQPITGKGASLVANLDLPEDDLVIVVNDSDEDKDDEVHATENVETEDTLVPKSSSPSSLPTELNDLPSKLNDLTEEVKGLKNQVHNLEIKHLGELKGIPPSYKVLQRLSLVLPHKGDSVPSTGQASTLPAVGEKNTNQATIAPLKQRGSISEEAVKESTKSDSDDDETHLSGSMVESSRIKKVKKFDFDIEDKKHIHW